jgi:hypothetical protein
MVEFVVKPLGKLKVTRSINKKKSSSSKDEDRSIIGAFPEGSSCSNTSEGGEMTPSTGILEVMEFQTAPEEESWHRWQQDFPLQRESILA